MYFNQNNNFYRNSPINIPSRRTYYNPIMGRKNVPFKDLIQKAERSVDTINSIIPLYKKVQPIIEQGKTVISSINTFFNKNNKEVKTTKNVEKVEAEIIDEKENKDIKTNYRNNESQSKPFFI